MAAAAAAAAALALVLGSCTHDFGPVVSSFIPGESTAPTPCDDDTMCGVDFGCCGGRCARCCADVDCDAQSACVPGLCRDGACTHGEAFVYPDWTSAVEPLAHPRRAIPMGATTLLVMERSIAATGPIPGKGEGVISTQSFPGVVADVVTSFGLAAVLVEPEWGGREIHLVDLSLPRWPRLTVVAVLDGLTAIDMEGFLLFAASPAGLWIVSVADALEPRTISEIVLWCDDPTRVDAAGGLALVECEGGKRVAVDVSDPAKPAIVEKDPPEAEPAAADVEPPAWIAKFDRIVDADFEGRRGAIAFEGGGILIVDAADPTSPRAVQSLATGGHPIAIAWASPEGVAVVESEGRVVIAGTGEDTGKDRVIPYADLTGAMPVDVASAGQRLAVADSDGMVAFVEHVGIEKPVVLGGIALAAPSMIAAFAENTLFLASTDQGGGRMQSIPVPAGSAEPGPASEPWEAAWPAMATDGLVVADSPAGEAGPLRLRRLENGVPDGKEASVAGAGAALVAVHEGNAWTVGKAGHRVVRPAFPGAAIVHAAGVAPALTGATWIADMEGGVALIGPGALFMAEGTLPPTTISEVRDAGTPDPSLPISAAAAGGRLYLAQGSRVWRDGGSGVDLAAGVEDLAAGDHVLAAALEGGSVAILSIDQAGDPANGSVVAMPGGSGAAGVAIAGKAACVAAGDAGLVILDVSTPAKAAITGSFAGHGAVTSVASRKLWCFGLARDGKVIAVSVVDPKDPRLAGTLGETGGKPESIWPAGNEIAAITEGGTLAILSVKAPPESSVIGEVDVPGLDRGLALGFARSDDVAIVAGPVTWILRFAEDDSGLAGVYASPWDPGSVTVAGDGSLIGAGGGTIWTLDLSCVR